MQGLFFVHQKLANQQSKMLPRISILFVTCLLISFSVPAQQISSSPAFAKKLAAETCRFTDAGSFIQNIGQYGEKLKGHEYMGNIQLGYEGSGMPVLFTAKGIIYLHRKVKSISHEEEEKLEKSGIPEEVIEKRKTVIDKVIAMQWIGANNNPAIIYTEKTEDYHTYGFLQEKAYGYKQITYKDLYPGIDLVYSFPGNNTPGFEFSFIVQPGADPSLIKMKFNGDVRSIRINNKKELVIGSGIDEVTVSVPTSYYGEKIMSETSSKLSTGYSVKNKLLGFSFPKDRDRSKAFVIDPFVSTTSNLPGLNVGKAKDVDFDYAGNIYVTGGGSQPTTHSLAKYNAAGVLQWTFNGTLTIPSWTFGTYYGGWMVEKPTGHIYLGQGFDYPTGFSVVRINTTGLYDNYITTANGSFTEAWKMFWNCNNGSPEILVAGGGINSNINFGVFAPPSTTVSSLNVTGIPYGGISGGWAQDIADFVFDPVNNDMYTIYGSLFGTPSIGNRMYKNTAPYSSASIVWNVPSGYNTVSEAANRPYLVASGLVDNSANMLWVNASYLYYWDGKNLKAFNKSTGAGVGTPLVTANTAFMQGGIIADACNNIFVGEANGLIKVYQFNGSTFSDAPADIVVPGFSGKSVYDLAYDEAKKLLYASGNGFVASFDISSYCTNSIYTINITPNCTSASATAVLNPLPPAGSNVTFSLYNGTTLITTNTNGIFTGLSPNTTYNIIATINMICSGVQSSASFTIPAPTIATSHINTTCGNNTGSITITASGGTPPYSYSSDGVNFQPGNTFTGLAAGVYTITTADANGCKNTTPVIITNTNGPALSYTQTNATCGNNSGTVTANASGGILPYQFSIDGGVTYQVNNFFTGLLGGQYVLTVKDSNNCVNSAVVTITSGSMPALTAVPGAATCGQNNGTITAFGSGGAAPLQYSVNGNIYQSGNTFTGLAPGSYTVYVKDASGCIQTTFVTIDNSSAPVVSTVVTPASCGNINGTITASGTGGVGPYQYSIDGITYQASSIFFGLAAGTYTITIKDNTGCTSSTNAVVSSTNGPSVSATTVASSCAANTGSITASGSGGASPYQYSINGVTFQVSNIFNGLAAGNYIVYIRDITGCLGAVSVTVNAVAGPSITASSTPSACNVNNGTITATGSGGTPPLQYSINGTAYQASNTFSGLATGTYTVYVKDANNCIKTTSVIVADAAGLTLNVTTIDASCHNNDGQITAFATGVATPLQYSINGTTYQASNIFTGLTGGSYTVYVKDANNCLITKPATLFSVGGPSLTVSFGNASCGASNGFIMASGSGGIAPLSYSINGTTFQSSGNFLNLAPATYTVTVKDNSGCISTQSVTITTSGSGGGISTFTVSITDAYLCNGALGRITNPRVNGSNCGSCTFSLNNGPFIPNATQLFTNLNPGVYLVTAKDANGCTKTIQVTVGIGVPSTASAIVTGTACNTSNGTIQITGIGPNTPYHASITGIGGPWITFDPSYTFTGLAPGIYTIILADDESFDAGPPEDPGGCLDTIEVVVPSIGGPSISTVIVNSTCQQSNGSITINTSGGTAPYTYSIDGVNYFSTNGFFNLGPGTYVASVQDDAGCTNFKNVTVTSTPSPIITATTLDASCGLNNGSITASASGGTAPLQYSLDGLNFQSSTAFSNLAPGSYDVYVKDAGNCYDITTVFISDIPVVSVTAFAVAASCGNSNGIIIGTGSSGSAPYTYSIDSINYQSSNTFTGLSAGFYTLYIKDSRGCVSSTGVSINNSLAPTLSALSTAATCGNANGSITASATGGAAPLQYSIDGTSYQASNIFTGLLPGTYTVYVKDFNGCINTKTILVANTTGPQTLTAVTIDEACGQADGSIFATATGGTAPLQYSIDGITYQASDIFNNISAGNYTLYVKDNNGCVKTTTITVLNLGGPALSAATSPATCGLSDGTITANASGGTGIPVYSIDGINYQLSNIFLALPDGNYTVYVMDERGCVTTTNATITVLVPPFTGALAARVGGPQASKSAVVPVTGMQYFDPLCELIDRVVPSGASPVSGMIHNHVIIDATVQYISSITPYVQRHFDAEPEVAPSTSTATITLYFKDQEFVEFNNNRNGYFPLPTVAGGGNADTNIINARVIQYHGVPIPPHDQGNPAPDFYTGIADTIIPSIVHYDSIYDYWEVTFPVTGFSGFYLTTYIIGILPVNIHYFTGHRRDTEHILDWKISCTDASPGSVLTLERSPDNNQFSALYDVTLNATICEQPFQYIDLFPLTGRNYYRLKITGNNGLVSYSNIVLLNNTRQRDNLISIIPNPITGDEYSLQIISPQAAEEYIKIVDMHGHVLEEKTVLVTRGTNSFSMSAAKLAAGGYAVIVTSPGKETKVVRFIKQK